MAYEVHIEVFDGPFDLLLRLIAAQEVDVYEVRLADIVDAFLAETRRIGTLDLELATQFLLVAATLVELKCRRLLPGGGEVDLDDELALFEARDYLLARLVECKTFSGAAAVLALLEQGAQRSLARRAGPDERFEGCAPDLLADVTAAQLAASAERALASRPVEPTALGDTRVEEVSVHATIEELVATLPARGAVTFRELTESSASRAEVVACFLALLELYKRALVDLDQAETFGALTVVWLAHDAVTASEIVTDEYEMVEPPDERRRGRRGAPSGPPVGPGASRPRSAP
ncbi:MAG: ScpA family protein [Actinomycetota bacterium]|nr:ScpA family protein [Actinomycetota bacterium]